MLKSYSAAIAAVITTAVVFSALFIPLSVGAISPTTTPTAPVNNSSNDFNTPTLLWKYPTNSGVGTYYVTMGTVHTAPIVDKGILYFASDEGTIYAVNVTNGKNVWQTAVADNSNKFPMIDNNKLYHGGNRHIYALDAKSGSLIWESRVASGHSANVGAPPVIANNILYVSFDYDLFRALNAKTGEIIWQFPDPTGPDPVFAMHFPSSPLVVDKVVYVGGANTVFALDARGGREIWNYSINYVANYMNPSLSSFVFDKGMLYFCAGDGNAYALDAGSGKKIWNTTYTLPGVPPPGIYVPPSPVLKNGIIHIGSGVGDVCALNATDGTKIWNTTVDAYLLSTPALYGDILYFGSYNGTLYALNATNGFELWSYPISPPNGGSAGSPIVYSGVLYVGGGDGVYALRVSPPLEEPPLEEPLIEKPPIEEPSSTPVLSTFHILIIVGIIVVVTVYCLGIYLIKNKTQNRKVVFYRS
jgi:outer membrane protein assembly factor BamB